MFDSIATGGPAGGWVVGDGEREFQGEERGEERDVAFVSKSVDLRDGRKELDGLMGVHVFAMLDARSSSFHGSIREEAS